MSWCDSKFQGLAREKKSDEPVLRWGWDRHQDVLNSTHQPDWTPGNGYCWYSRNRTTITQSGLRLNCPYPPLNQNRWHWSVQDTKPPNPIVSFPWGTSVKSPCICGTGIVSVPIGFVRDIGKLLTHWLSSVFTIVTTNISSKNYRLQYFLDYFFYRFCSIITSELLVHSCAYKCH